MCAIDSAHVLEGCGPHVPDDEPARFDDLPIQRPGYVHGVELIRLIARTGADLVAPVGHRLHVGVGQPTARLLARHQDPRDRGPQRPLLPRSCHAQLAQKRVPLIVGARSPKPLPQGWRQVLDAGAVDDLPIETDEGRLAALLKHPREMLGGHGPLRTRHAVQEAAGTAVHEQATRNLHLDHRRLLAVGGGQKQPKQRPVLKRRVDRARTYFLDEIDDGVEPLDGDADDVACTVLDAQHEHAAAAVGERGKLVCQSISARTGNFVACETHFLEFEEGALAQTNLVEQFLRAIEHAAAPLRAAGSGARTPRVHLPSPDRPPPAWCRSPESLAGGRSTARESQERAASVAFSQPVDASHR